MKSSICRQTNILDLTLLYEIKRADQFCELRQVFDSSGNIFSKFCFLLKRSVT